jgi:predicted ferric reductase
MAKISKPDANPIAAALLTWFILGIGHIVINGQTNKWVWTLVATLIGSFLCVLPGIVIGILSVVDSYQTAERLSKGEVIEENEYSNVLLYKICKILDKKATCKFA